MNTFLNLEISEKSVEKGNNDSKLIDGLLLCRKTVEKVKNSENLSQFSNISEKFLWKTSRLMFEKIIFCSKQNKKNTEKITKNVIFVL